MSYYDHYYLQPPPTYEEDEYEEDEYEEDDDVPVLSDVYLDEALYTEDDDVQF